MEKYEYDISVCASAVRPELWEEMYRYYMKSSASIELVFVGDKYPSFKLPSNFKFIYSEVKPSQCVEIAIRNCNGEYILIQSDDCAPEKDYCDNMLSIYKKSVKEFPDKKIITGGEHYYGNNVISQRIGVWPKSALPLKIMPMDFFISNKWYKEIGGVDKNFVGMYYHFDIALRVLETGGKHIYNNLTFREKNDTGSKFESITSRVRPIDQKYLRSIWWCYWNKTRWKRKYGTVSKYRDKHELWENKIAYHTKNTRGFIPVLRNKKFEPFDDKDILTISQGRVCGKWEK